MFLALNLTFAKKQRFAKHLNFFNDKIYLKNFDAKLLQIDKKDYNEIDIYYIGYVTVKKMIIVIILTV